MTTAISIDAVSKRFRMYRERLQSVKERVIRFGRVPYEDFWALKDISFDIEPGETFGLIGPNGSGKTTLLKCVAGILRPSSGTITTAGRVASLLELGAGFHPDLTGRENVFMNASILGLSRAETNRFFDSIVAFSELEPFIDMQVKHYSSGMYVRLGFAVAVHVDPDIILVDEVLAVGDEKFQRKCLDKMRSFGKEGRTILIVTHAVDLLPGLCSRACALFKGEVTELGEPHQVVRSFRELIHEIETQGPDAGGKDGRIIEVRICDGTGASASILKPGEPMEIVVDADFVRPVDDPFVSFLLLDKDNRELFRTSSRLRKLDLGRVEGKVRFRIRIPELPLLTPTCHVSVGIHDTDGNTIHSWQRAAGFHVHPEVPEHGVVHIPYTIEVEPL